MRANHPVKKWHIFIITCLIFPSISFASGFKFRISNTAKTKVAVFYKLTDHSGNFKIKSLFSLEPRTMREKEISLKKDDTISFYAQDAEDQTSVTVKKNFTELLLQKNAVINVPILIPEKTNTSFESLEGLSVKLEHNKVLNFLLKLDSTSMSSLSMLEKNFQNTYPLGTFIFVDVKTNRLLLPPLEPSFWNNTENYLAIQDSLYAMVDKDKRGQANAQVAYFVAKMFDSLHVNHTAELEFKAKLSLVRWKPAAQANIYQIFNDKSFQDFLQNCYAQIDNPDKEYQRYRLYFLSSYERIDDLEIFGRQFFNLGNETDLSVSMPTQVFNTNIGVMFARTKTLSNYFSVQGAVLRTKAYDFTSLLFNGFKSNVKKNIIAEDQATQRRITQDIKEEYSSLVAYNPDPQGLSLQALDPKGTDVSLLPIRTTLYTLSPYPALPPDTSKQVTPASTANSQRILAYNNKAKLFNSHLAQLTVLFKDLYQVDADLDKITASAPEKTFSGAANAPGLLNEIEVNSQIVRKE